MQRRHTITLAVDGDALPTEFRLFKAGWNETENGRFLFDEKAAKSVMACYAAWGVDLSIDLEHQMLEVEPGASPDPTARDARGHCKLELRKGELWACDVTWTPDGAERLKQKRQRYVSPAFEADPKTKRVLKMINVAITSIPATHKTPALVAASANGKGGGMDPKLIKAALEAIEKGDAKAALDILKGLVASAAGADPDADGDADGSEGDGAEGVAPPAEETDAVEDPKVVDNDGAPPPAKDGDGSDDDEADEDKPAKKTERKAMRAMLRSLTGTKSFAEALSKVEEFRASHMTLATERVKLAKERATLEAAERRRLVADLVKLGAEFPATVWADDAATTLKPRWAKLPIAELRAHVADQRKARGAKPVVPGVKPPPGEHSGAGEAVTLDDGRVVHLSADEVRTCSSMKCELKNFAALKALRDSKEGN